MYAITYIIQGKLKTMNADSAVTALFYQRFLNECGIKSTVARR